MKGGKHSRDWRGVCRIPELFGRKSGETFFWTHLAFQTSRVLSSIASCMRWIRTNIFGTITPDDPIATERMTRYGRCQCTASYRFGLSPTIGRIGSWWSRGDWSTLLIRNFYVDQSGECVDVPWNETPSFWLLHLRMQHLHEFGRFSELEYHIPAIDEGRVETAARIHRRFGPIVSPRSGYASLPEHCCPSRL